MKRQPRILAGTAIGLLMASAPLGAYPLQGGVASGSLHGAPLVLAQAACAEGQSAEECAQQGGEQPRKKKREQQQQSESAPAGQAAPAETEQKPRKKRQDQQQTDNGQSGEAPAEQQLKPRKKRDQQQQTEAAPADQGGQPATDEQQPRKKKRNQAESAPAEQPAEQVAPDQQQQQLHKRKLNQQQSETAPAEQVTPDQQQQLRKRKLNQQQGETAPAEQATPDQQQQLRKRKLDQQQQGETAPAEQATPDQQQQLRKRKLNQQQETAPAEQQSEQPANDNQPGKKRKQGQQPAEQGQQPAEQGQAPAEQAPAGQGSRKLKPLPVPGTEQAPAGTEQAPAQGEQPLNQNKRQAKKPLTEQPATGQQQPATGEQPANNNQPAAGGNAAQGQALANPNEAPLLDSQKDVLRRHQGRQPAGQNQNGQVEQGGNQAGQQAARQAPVNQGPPPTDDKTAQQAIQPEKIAPVIEEKGKRVDLTPQEVVRDRRRPQGADVVQQLGDRVILQFNNQTFVESNEAPRITRGARDVYYEDLSGGRTREIVDRENGIQIVTIRNRNGDVIRRSRITPDGREYVLSYVDERYYNDVDEWRDPGDDLPPMRLDMPRRDYILDSEDIQSDDDYYTFLEQPPVERVQRLYSIDEVKRSARVRDIARRIDLDTLNFDFGSATISDTEVQKLDGVASAMEKLLKKNPAETFLIEGHTDAVGTPEANLALSDRRAESVAEALTNAFGIPAENLTTQGYGEQYLKVNTPGPNRENRRVAIRRITSLVAPVASNSEQ
ncbi:OmpA family protein [Mesorhizobium sp. VK25A]|uniref:OmpA family protein n=1 Tax=Mesorhizobium vachelliae TaxID=3072309 RepID=A0ABU5AF60_9HYPH|nr:MULTISPECIES: OmpA family protein [unclassified Mesorhizobium]MDX8535929.1 OmpA family protein [Mesorhizobium sp. VK25D]MDX8548683.1 OmpA family protein [Mesorhizobium sp. VK25A]